MLGGKDQDPAHGYILGPPLELWDSLEDIPEETRLRLHNELYYREILTAQDAKAQLGEVEAALKSALKLDRGRVVEAYNGNGHQDDR